MIELEQKMKSEKSRGQVGAVTLLVGLAVATIFGFIILSSVVSGVDYCSIDPGRNCSASWQGKINSTQTNAYTAMGFIGISLLVVGAGIIINAVSGFAR